MEFIYYEYELKYYSNYVLKGEFNHINPKIETRVKLNPRNIKMFKELILSLEKNLIIFIRKYLFMIF